jgi:hypothetical protein
MQGVVSKQWSCETLDRGLGLLENQAATMADSMSLEEIEKELADTCSTIQLTVDFVPSRVFLECHVAQWSGYMFTSLYF